MTDIFVTTEWLAARLRDPGIALLDCSWFLPAANRRPHEEYLASHIPGAVFFDIDGVADKTTGLPHMLLKPEEFGRAVSNLGVGDGMTIVLYDEAGLFSAPRVWWEFLTMGATDIRILEGGGPKWRVERRPLDSGEERPVPRTFTPHFHPELVKDLAQMRQALADKITVVDARPNGRFIGRDPEPRPGVVNGHMPGSVSVPSADLVGPDGKLKPITELRAIFDKAGVDFDRPLITSCGSGVTAAVDMLALKLAGAKNLSLYDGAWAEWGSRKDTPILRD